MEMSASLKYLHLGISLSLGACSPVRWTTPMPASEKPVQETIQPERSAVRIQVKKADTGTSVVETRNGIYLTRDRPQASRTPLAASSLSSHDPELNGMKPPDSGQRPSSSNPPPEQNARTQSQSGPVAEIYSSPQQVLFDQVLPSVDWGPRRWELEDRVLVLRVQSLNNQLPLQEKIVREAPDDQELRKQVKRLERRIQASSDSLVACGERHVLQNIRLAEHCLTLALAIRDESGVRRLLDQVNSRHLQKRAKIQRRQNLRRSETQRTQAATYLQKALGLARETSDPSSYWRLNDIITHDLTTLETEASSVHGSLGLVSRINEQLLEVADRFYRTDQVAAAIACWQATLALTPDLKPVEQKLERAKRVLDNLTTLKRRSSLETGNEKR